MILETISNWKSMMIYTLSSQIAENLHKYKISQNRHAILALILKSGIFHQSNLLCSEMCLDVTMSKHCIVLCHESDTPSKILLFSHIPESDML